MKEVELRSKLIKLYKIKNKNGFIWAMDARFKRGFPDLYIVENGSSYHVELKLLKTPRLDINKIAFLFTEIQKQTIRKITENGVVALGLIYHLPEKKFLLGQPNKGKWIYFSYKDFYKDWGNTNELIKNVFI